MSADILRMQPTTLGDDFAIAALLWSVGADTREIADRLRVPEHVVANQIDAIKEAEREIKAGQRP